MKRYVKLAAIASALLFLASAVYYFVDVSVTEAAVVKAGSHPADIKVVQYKLRKWGYYTGTVDGIYGSGTTSAVKKFQSKNGLVADGIVGNKTLSALGVSVGLTTSSAVLKKGNSGSDVRKLQQRLSDLGYSVGTVDGVYGSKTVEAVKKFQRDNYLTADGIAGSKTLSKLGINVVGGSSTGGSTNSDLYLLAKCIYAEARGEPYIGKVAVGAVILNRVKSPDFPNTIAGVIYQPGAFTAVSDGQINLSPDSEATRAAQDAMNGWDPSYGSIFYYNPAKATSSWIYSRKVIVTIGKHVFCV